MAMYPTQPLYPVTTRPRVVIPATAPIARVGVGVTAAPHRSHKTLLGALTLIVMLALVALGMAGPGLGRVLLGGAQSAASWTAHADPLDTEMRGARALVYHRGYSQQGAWLCFGWPSGAFHCTTRFFRTRGGTLVSLNTAWVPNTRAAAAVISATRASTQALSTALAPLNNRTTGYAWGQCTYGAALLAHDNVSGLGNAYQWFAAAQARGLPTGYTPRVGATVVFQRGVDGASWTFGHVAHVVAVYPNGSFQIEAMNDVAGFGRFGFRTVWMNWGVSFIY